MDKILDKIIKQVIVESTTRKRLTKQIDSDTILNKLIKQVITEAAQKVVLSKLDNKVGAIVSKYCFGFKISANFPIKPAQIRTQIQGNSQFGTDSPYNSYLNYTYFVGSNMHKNPDKKFVANVIIVDAKTMKSFNSALFNLAVQNLLDPDAEKADAVGTSHVNNTVGRKDADLEAQHHKARGPEAVYNSTFPGDKYNRGSSIVFIDKTPGYANLPADLMTVLTKKGAALMSTSGSEVPGFMNEPGNSDDENGSSSEIKTINVDAKSLYDTGKTKWDSKDYKGALADFDEAIKLDSEYAEAYYYRGITKSELNDLNGGLADITTAIELEPSKNPWYYLNRGFIKSDLKDDTGELADYDKAIKLDPGLAYAYYVRGAFKVDQGSFEDAQKDFDKTIELDPTFKGLVDGFKERIAQGVSGSQDNPGAAITYFKSGGDKYNLKDYKGAIQDYDKAIELDSKYAEAYFERGRCKHWTGDKKGAILDLKKAEDLDPELQLKIKKEKEEEEEKAAELVKLNKAIELDPTNAKAYSERSSLKSRTDKEGAIADINKAIELDPNNKQYFMARGYYEEDTDPKGAIADFTKAIELDPTFAYAYENRARVKAFSNLKDYAGAIPDYDKAIELNSAEDEDNVNIRERGKAKNLLEPGSGDEDLKTSAEGLRKQTDELNQSIKKQTFKYGIRDNADLKKLQDEIKTQLKASTNQTYIKSVPSFKAFMNVANMTGYYGTLTSNMIGDLKRGFDYKNTDGKTIESDFMEILIDKMNSKLKLTEQFNFTDSEKKLISNKPVVVNTKTVDTKTVDTKTVDTKTVKLKNLDQIPLGSNNWRSAQPTSTQLAKFIIEKGIKSVIRFNGNGGDTDNNFSIDDEKAVSTQNGAKFYKLSSTKDQDTVNSLLNSGNVLIHCHHGADRTGGNIGGWLYSKGWGDTKKIWNYTTQYNGWNRMAINSPSSFSKGGYLYQATKFGVKDINHAQELANGNKSIKKGDTKKDEPLSGDRLDVALTKAYQICLDAAKYLKKITTTNPHDHWSKYLRWNGASYRPNANEKGIAWFKSSWEKYYGTKLAAASKIRNTVTQRNINELNRRKNDIIEMIRKGGSMTVYLRIQNPSTGAPTDFKIKWDYFAGIQNAAVKGNPKKTVTKKPSSKIGGNLGR